MIDVTWDGMSWTVYRRYNQFNDFNSQAKKASFTFSHALPKKKLQGNLKDQFIEQRQVNVLMIGREAKRMSQIVINMLMGLFDDEPRREQRELQKYVQAVGEKASGMLSNKKARVALLRFFAPTQVGDKGPAAGTALPFDLSELVE